MRAQRDTEGIEAGTTRSMANAGETTPAMGDMTPGTAEVHTDVRIERESGFGAIAASDTTEGRSMQQEAKNRMNQATEQAQSMADQAQQKARQTASQAASQAQSKASQAMNRVESQLNQSGVMSTVRNNPLPALGIAFGIGFLLAGDGDEEEQEEKKERHAKREQKRERKRRKGGGGVMQSATKQLKGAIMGGLSAAIAQEGKNLVGMAQGKGNQGGILGSLVENMAGGKSSQGQAPHRRPSHQEMR